MFGILPVAGPVCARKKCTYLSRGSVSSSVRLLGPGSHTFCRAALNFASSTSSNVDRGLKAASVSSCGCFCVAEGDEVTKSGAIALGAGAGVCSWRTLAYSPSSLSSNAKSFSIMKLTMPSNFSSASSSSTSSPDSPMTLSSTI